MARPYRLTMDWKGEEAIAYLQTSNVIIIPEFEMDVFFLTMFR